MRYLGALRGFNELATALDAAERCLREFRTQDGPMLLGALMTNRTTGPAVWRYVTAHWDEVTTRFSPNLHSRTVGGIATFITDPDLADEVESFHRAHPVAGGYPATVEQQLERLRIGLRFAESLRRES